MDNKTHGVLKPCPFCGSKNIDAAGWASENTSGPACDDCGAGAGSVLDSKSKNIEAWNRRAPQSPVAPEDERALSDIPSDSIELLERAARARLADAPKRADTIPLLIEQVKFAERDRDGARAEVIRRDQRDYGVVWWWQGDGTDNLDTITCDVVIRPDVLRALIAGAPTVSATVTDSMIDAYLTDKRKTVEEADRFGRPNIGGLHTDTVRAALPGRIGCCIQRRAHPRTRSRR